MKQSVEKFKSGWWIRAAFLAALVVGGGVAAYRFTEASYPAQAAHKAAVSASQISIPMFFEPNRGQTDARVKFLAHGAGYGLFLTSDEAVLMLQQPRKGPNQGSADAAEPLPAASVIRMRLDGASVAASIHGTQPLPGKSSYFIGNDPKKWHRDIPQFGRVEYQAVYPGIDLVYYGNQRQLEYDFRVAPGADPSQIALEFQGSAIHIEGGDLVLSTSSGDVRFHAPHIYQPGAKDGAVSGSFRQLANNKIGFAIGPYDHSRELVIDPTLSYSTYLGGGGTESLVKVAVDGSSLIYLAGTTNSADFPTIPVGNSQLTGSQNLFISKIDPTQGTSGLLYSIYLGSHGIDLLGAIAVDRNSGIYVAGTTSSSDVSFPTTSNAFQTKDHASSAQHGFLSLLSLSGGVYSLQYSTYLAGNGTDQVTGLAIDATGHAFLTGTTTSSNDQSGDGFPSNGNGYQLVSNSPGNLQFFASKINTLGSGTQSMLYSTYFGGGNPVGATAIGGGIAIDASGNMYFTGATNMLQTTGPNQEPKFPLFNAFQACLNQNCTTPDSSHTDAILVKLNPNQVRSAPVYSTYLGGTLDDIGTGISVDTSSNAYITGGTFSGATTTPFGCISPCVWNSSYAYGGGEDAFIAKVNNVPVGSTYWLYYFTYIGGSGDDVGNGIAIDPVGFAHIAGSTTSPDLPQGDRLQNYAGNGDAFAAVIATSTTATTGNIITYLGGASLDQGTGLAIDAINSTYVAGNTVSADFPLQSPYQDVLNNGSQDAFVSKITNKSDIRLTQSQGSPSPSPVAAGAPAAFKFTITNNGPDPAALVSFLATVPTTGTVSSPTAKVLTGTGSCTALQGSNISCLISNVAVGAAAQVEVDITPSITQPPVTQIKVTGQAGVFGGPLGPPVDVFDNVVDFSMSASPSSLTVNDGDLAAFPITLTPNPGPYSATITMSQTTSPSIVTQTTPTFTNPTVTLGSGQGSTTLNIQTVKRPTQTGSVFHRGPIYATWLPIGGLSLLGLGVGVSSKRRRWLAGIALGLLMGLMMLLPACNSASNPISTSSGTLAGTYTITVTGSAGNSSSHNITLKLIVN